MLRAPRSAASFRRVSPEIAHPAPMRITMTLDLGPGEFPELVAPSGYPGDVSNLPPVDYIHISHLHARSSTMTVS